MAGEKKSDLPPLPPSPLKRGADAPKPPPRQAFLPGYNRSIDWIALGTRGPLPPAKEFNRQVNKDEAEKVALARRGKLREEDNDLLKRPLTLKGSRSLRGRRR